MTQNQCIRLFTLFGYFYCIFLNSSHAIRHGRNLIWAGRPLNHDRASIVGIEGDPDKWVLDKKMTVRQISSPSRMWHFRSLAYSYSTKYLYWSESGLKRIQGLVLDGYKKETDNIFTGTSAEVDGLAVDWISGNLYWTDAIYNWIMMVPLRPNQKRFKIITKVGLDKPHGIAVLPQKGYLFWCDWGVNPKIEVSDLVGNNRRPIVSNNMRRPRGLVIDAKESMIYWVDDGQDTIECIQFNGRARRTLVEDPQADFYGIALYKNILFVTEQSRSEGHLNVYSKLNGQLIISYTLSHIPYGIIMYDEATQPGNSEICDALECEHFCVHNPIMGPACHCSEGYELNITDHRTCKVDSEFPQPYHVYSMEEGICSFPPNLADIDLENMTLSKQCFLMDNKGYLALGMHARRDTLYFSTNNTEKWINRVRMEYGASFEYLIGGVGIVRGIVLDWISSNLYWTDSLLRTINVARADGMYQQVLIDSDLENPVGIAVHPGKSKLFWTDAGNSPKVEWSYLDGSGRSLITNRDLGSPSHIHIDFMKDILYWADSALGNVKEYNFSTEIITVLVPKNSGIEGSIYVKAIHCKLLLLDYLIWTDYTTSRNGIHVARLDNLDKVRDIVHPEFGRARDLLTFDASNQPDFETACADGSCEHLCLPKGEKSYTCRCGLGYQIGENKKFCATDLATDNFLLVTDSYRKQIFQISMITGKVQALDVRDHFRPLAVDYDPVRQIIYWTDVAHKSIKKAEINGVHETLVKKLTDDSIADGLAIDYVNQLLFYSDAGIRIIGVMTLSAYPFHKTLINSGLEKVRSVIASPIEKQIEIREKRLYWVDARSNKIASMTTDGKQQNVLYSESDAHYFGIALSGDYLYLTDWSRNSLMRLSKRGGQLENFWDGTSKFVRLNDIHAFNSTEIISEVSPCSSESCSHFCLPSPRTIYEIQDPWICACPDHLILSSDGHNCVVDEEQSSSFAGWHKHRDSTTHQISSITDESESMNNRSTQRALFHSKQTKNGSSVTPGKISAYVIVPLILLGAGVAAFIFLKRRRAEKNPHCLLENDDKYSVDISYRILCQDSSKDMIDGTENPIENQNSTHAS
ncbi:low-density lipoprotein receptor-related protein 5 [Octopus bimaculoides]|uniref:low-density lipoprotein receptor-related protein 5 n=1 Tax=Octopus bimaculoides TaxID=37653 RepID=UPI00071C28DE|nr:low-density lipoprotein receptor-related protein 5 [Octopus bimaculoides]|eukprot:XP_014768919.1 PREDICTED: low-density lipoprotein receptor-related protein 5-like [Octopus bimaculoides]